MVAEALAILRAPEARSLGIVTFNAEQQGLIEDLLDKAAADAGLAARASRASAPPRHRTFLSLAELNVAIAALVEQLNDRPMRGWGTTRRALFDQFDRQALSKLPAAAYECADWRKSNW